MHAVSIPLLPSTPIMERLRSFLVALLFLLSFTSSILVLSQQDLQSGFISLDCGTARGENYTDDKTGLRYTSDASFIGENAVTKMVSPYYKGIGIERQLKALTSFPKGIRNCYTLRPANGKQNKYLIRARFFYGNYDVGNADDNNNNNKELPQFDVHLGVEYWDTVQFDPKYDMISVDKEIVHVPSSDLVHVCLVNTGLGTPFISVLELRPLINSMYPTVSGGSLMMNGRYDAGSEATQALRYKDDVFDRIWVPFTMDSATSINDTTSTVNVTDTKLIKVPPGVMNTALIPKDPDQPLTFWWPTNSSSDKLYIYMSFAEIQKHKPNETREFNIYLNGDFYFGPISPPYMRSITLFDRAPDTNHTEYHFSLNKTENSTLPPILNALEVYYLKAFTEPQTDDNEVVAMISIKSDYDVSKNWEGDPCSPKSDAWIGLKCNYPGFSTPTITSMNLSSSGLTGSISPYISNLTMLQVLDLSNNNLTGPVPDFLSQLPSLSVLNLSGNNFSGPVPAKLLQKSKHGNLTLSIDQSASSDTNSCQNGSCDDHEKKKNVVVPIVASVASVLLLVLAIGGILLVVIKRRKQREAKVGAESKKNDDALQTKNRRYTFAKIREITNNFEKVLGKGGFGEVYHGCIDDGTQVAVKMLSSSSGQGLKEFQAEANVLMNVHHKNLTALVGYCIEDTNIGIIYEFMANGNLQQHLSARNHNVLSFRDRLQIAIDSAQGLEYLHHGCKPPIVHRDVKCTNILLDEKFQAKLADFGLSRAFPAENGTHISTIIAGTPGYLDPEYYISNRLTEKGDIFSFGVVILEIITGKPAIIGTASEHDHITHWVTSTLENGDIRDVVDPTLMGEFDVSSAWKAVELAMACVSQESNNRPTMNEVVNELKDCLATEMARQGTSLETSINNSSSAATFDLESEPLAR